MQKALSASQKNTGRKLNRLSAAFLIDVSGISSKVEQRFAFWLTANKPALSRRQHLDLQLVQPNQAVPPTSRPHLASRPRSSLNLFSLFDFAASATLPPSLPTLLCFPHLLTQRFSLSSGPRFSFKNCKLGCRFHSHKQSSSS